MKQDTISGRGYSPAWIALVMALTAGAAGCGRHAKPAPTGGSDVPPAKVNLKRGVELGRAEQRSIVFNVETVGVLEAEGQTEMAAGVTGVVDEVLFREGDLVTAETVLIKVDQRRYEDAVKVAEANERRAEANLALAKDADRRAQRAGAGTSAEEKAKLSLFLGVAEAELLSSRATLDSARNNLDRSRVHAPYTGRINQRKITRGSYLEEKTIIATMADLSCLRLVGWVPETAAPTARRLMVQQEANVRAARITLPLGSILATPMPVANLAGTVLIQKADDIPSGFDPEFALMPFPNRIFRGRIFYMSSIANPDTHMFEIKAEVNSKASDVELRPGYTARIRLPLRSNPNACVIPEEAVRASERGSIAFIPVLRKGRDGQGEWVAQERKLDLGYRAPGWVEVLHGIVPGEWLVRKGAESLEEGTPIRFAESQLEEMTAGR